MKNLNGHVFQIKVLYPESASCFEFIFSATEYCLVDVVPSRFARSLMKNLVPLNVAFISFCKNAELGQVTWPMKDVFHMSHAPLVGTFLIICCSDLYRGNQSSLICDPEDHTATTITS